MLVNEQNVVLEACVQMWLEPQLNNDRVVVAVDVGVDTVETLEHVANERRECLREWNTNTTREHLLVVDVRLHPCHQVFDVFGSRHLGRSLVVFTVLPEVLKSTPCQTRSSVQSVYKHTHLLLSSQDKFVESRIR
jgi:hypothetical protein